MKSVLAAIALLVILTGSTPAMAWNADGHALTGAVADRLLNPRARAEVRRILGYDLATASKWADCVKSVRQKAPGVFAYEPDPAHPEYRVPCPKFETPAERARMEDYVARNWSNCDNGPNRGCHETYHYTNMAVQRGRYDQAFVGANEHDIVAAIQAAQAVLMGRAAPAPFSIKDRKEAILLIAHMVGDAHQPLHVGGVYLDERGQWVDPDPGPPNPATETRGGNSLTLGETNLHAHWDDEFFGVTPTAQMLKDARALPVTEGAPTQWPAAWASETNRLSRIAFDGLEFGPKAGGRWPVLNADTTSYKMRHDALQRTQLIRGGARLAQLLNSVWP